MINRKYEDRICKVCGLLFATRTDHTTEHCSFKCAGVTKKVKAGLFRKCKFCGKDFIAKKQATQCCSNACGSKLKNFSKNQEVSCSECGKVFVKPNCHVTENNYCSRDCMSKYLIKNKLYVGEKSHHWKNGTSMQMGYLFIRTGVKKYKQLHRLIVEGLIGRELNESELVHHKDGNKLNNDWNNLEIVSRKEHIDIHRDSLYVNRRVI